MGSDKAGYTGEKCPLTIAFDLGVTFKLGFKLPNSLILFLGRSNYIRRLISLMSLISVQLSNPLRETCIAYRCFGRWFAPPLSLSLSSL